MELDPEQVAAARSFLQQRRTQGNISFLDALRLAQGFTVEIDSPRLAGPPTGAGTSAGGRTAPQPELPLPDLLPAQIPLESVSVEGWLEHTLEQLRFQQPVGEIDEPEHFQGTLRPYQRRGAGWLVYLRNLGLGACLADDMGLGKTIQAIAMLLHVREEAAAAHVGETPHLPALLICPTSVVANWKHETDRFAPVLRALIHHGTGRLTGDEFLRSAAVHDLIITSYGTARRDIELLTRIPWRHLIIDEAQNIKNPRAKQTQAVRRIQAPNRVALTGTPVENRLAELWSIMEFLNPGYFGEREAFRKRFIVPIERYNDDQRAAELRRLAQPFLLRRLKSDPNIISDLPEKNEMVVYCSLTEEQAALYEATVRQALATLEESSGIQRRGQVLALLTRLKQITNHPAHFLKEEGPLAGRSGKLDRLTEMLEEALSVDDQALVFTQFVEMGHLLQNHLRTNLGSDVLFLHGGTPARQRDRMVQEFQDKSGPPVFVLSLRAGGSGLNLTRANHVFHFDRWWNPAVENQATDRAFRIGQQRNVQVHKFVVAGTLEERINEMIESKQALAEAIVGSGEDWLTELNNDELQHLLMLRRGAL
ncbi:MAG: ATP-dependent helicase [Caldilineaceae bacterium]|nr:ATP-dependent helicase [Caldilineaceae bacterium]